MLKCLLGCKHYTRTTNRSTQEQQQQNKKLHRHINYPILVIYTVIVEESEERQRCFDFQQPANLLISIIFFTSEYTTNTDHQNDQEDRIMIIKSWATTKSRSKIKRSQEGIILINILFILYFFVWNRDNNNRYNINKLE